MEQIVQILAVVITGPLVGVEFGVAAFLNPILGRLPDEAYRQARGTGSRILGTVMPFWYCTAAVLLIAATLINPGLLLIAAVVLMGAVMVLTLTTLVPINNRIAAWAGGPADTAAAPPELAHRWDRLHRVRVALLAVLLVLVVTAAVAGLD
ncbi:MULTISPECIES: DUF1772 domain-containing protein [Mycolicibacterium]|uniref:DUF1772 domain-containing protein n=1 Tax=Mycolicibacterium mageritense TaxID=53462 RepID=A0AAI8XLQ5_MYCME|nr:DUF1772 domain-containing protein [Mycolicibacterium mageritense]MBN3452465.1 DUF1772 domain-containing protein [Mycobacterium sp. DSM 3803]OKH73039.1 hypothetical protein EB73_07930 [Mycobacterium sp. SWH-M3]BDY29844.1 hypothetical protein hbim_03787 [Mycolicibacterium mageritense]